MFSRFAIFFALLGLLTFGAAVFLPAMLVANSLEGAKWYSIWTGLNLFWTQGYYFLALLIAAFSLLLPLLKFGLIAGCAVGASRGTSVMRSRLVRLMEFTGKYSMLDVLVLAMIILLFKVDEYVRLVPTLGIYLFSFAILCSMIATALLKRALRQPPELAVGKTTVLPVLGAILTVAGLALLATGLWQGLRLPGDSYDRVTVTRLTRRAVPRMYEKALALKAVADKNHDFFSGDTLKKAAEVLQTFSTDTGRKTPEAYLILTSQSGQASRTSPLDVDINASAVRWEFPLPQPVVVRDLASLTLMTRVDYLKFVPVDNLEETLSQGADSYRRYMSTWYGQVFQFDFTGPSRSKQQTQIALIGLGGLLACWGLSGLLTRY